MQLKDHRETLYHYNRAIGKSIFQKLNPAYEILYNEEKKQMISEVARYISNYHSKIKPSDFNLYVLNPWYLTVSDLKLIEDLLKKGLTEEEVRAFIIETCPQEIANQYVDREKVINKSRERSLYLKRKFNKTIKED